MMPYPQFSLKTFLWTTNQSLRWAAVAGLAYVVYRGFAYGYMLLYVDLIVVVAGAMIAPRARRTTAIIFAAAQVSMAFWGHVLSTGGPWWSWTINYSQFSQEAFGAVLGVVYIFWSEKARARQSPASAGEPATLAQTDQSHCGRIAICRCGRRNFRDPLVPNAWRAGSTGSSWFGRFLFGRVGMV
jgi:hypothetical protein